jgi:hypothetical protein
MQIILAVELLQGRSRQFSSCTGQSSDRCPPLTDFRRILCHWYVVSYNGLEAQSAPAATLRGWVVNHRTSDSDIDSVPAEVLAAGQELA